jgi:hypothetical protein
MAYQIVTVNVSQTVGATPSRLQQMSAILSFGATLQATGKPVLLTQDSDITDLINIPIGTLQAAGGDFTLTLPPDRRIDRDAGSKVDITVSGCSPSAWNGTYTATLTDSSTLTWTDSESALTGSPATTGQFTVSGCEDLVTAVEAFFAQGRSVGTYLLELGHHGDSAADDVAALKAYIQEPLTRFYAYLVPEAWKGHAGFIALAKLYTSNESMQYFFVPESTPVDTLYVTPYDNIKSVIAVADDSFPETNAAAAAMWNLVSASPSEINKVPPMAFRYLQAVNASKAKDSILRTMAEQSINYVDTGAEGGIASTMLVRGVTGDGKDMTYWYSVDWVQINVDRALANAVINGSNNPINPLYYDQDGIDRLQQRAQGVFNTGGSYGLVNGAPVVRAIPFRTYTRDNPDDYATGRYAGFSASYTPMRGFTDIIFNINVTMQLS